MIKSFTFSTLFKKSQYVTKNDYSYKTDII